jgi:hypothetical protein
MIIRKHSQRAESPIINSVGPYPILMTIPFEGKSEGLDRITDKHVKKEELKDEIH